MYKLTSVNGIKARQPPIKAHSTGKWGMWSFWRKLWLFGICIIFQVKIETQGFWARYEWAMILRCLHVESSVKCVVNLIEAHWEKVLYYLHNHQYGNKKLLSQWYSVCARSHLNWSNIIQTAFLHMFAET